MQMSLIPSHSTPLRGKAHPIHTSGMARQPHSIALTPVKKKLFCDLATLEGGNIIIHEKNVEIACRRSDSTSRTLCSARSDDTFSNSAIAVILYGYVMVFSFRTVQRGQYQLFADDR